jgi:RNA exonuclease 1
MLLTLKRCVFLDRCHSLNHHYILLQCIQMTARRAHTWDCVIGFDSGNVMCDQLVKPPSPITTISPREFARCSAFLALNRNPSFSGIIAEALDPVTTTLADVQTYLRTRIQPSTILLGQSLESDLHVLQLAHPRCINTALLFHHLRGRPLKPGLAWLTRKWLGRTIQDRGPGGHNPGEDARACIDLLKAKIKNGASLLTCSSHCD